MKKFNFILAVFAAFTCLASSSQAANEPTTFATLEAAAKNNQAIVDSGDKDGRLIGTMIKYADGDQSAIFIIGLNRVDNRTFTLDFGTTYLGFALGSQSARRTLHVDDSGSVTWVSVKDQSDIAFTVKNDTNPDAVGSMATCMCGMKPVELIQNWKKSLSTPNAAQ